MNRRPHTTGCSTSPTPRARISKRGSSSFSAWIMAAHARGERYGLTLGSQVLDPSSGTQHREACLRRAHTCLGRRRDERGPPTRSHQASTLVFVGGLLLVSADAPLWCVAVAAVAAAWRTRSREQACARESKPRRRHALRIRRAHRDLSLSRCSSSFRTLNGLAAGTALLVLMGALKLIEARSRRDDGIVVGVALFLLLAAVLADQSMWRVPLYLLIVVGCGRGDGADRTTRAPRSRPAPRCACRPVPLPWRCHLPSRGIPVLSALRRTVLGPRSAARQAATGLTDKMEPGSIGSLAIEYEPAFRVHFEGLPPPREALYFRGPVLNYVRRVHLAPRAQQHPTAAISSSPQVPAGALSHHARTQQPPVDGLRLKRFLRAAAARCLLRTRSPALRQ